MDTFLVWLINRINQTNVVYTSLHWTLTQHESKCIQQILVPGGSALDSLTDSAGYRSSPIWNNTTQQQLHNPFVEFFYSPMKFETTQQHIPKVVVPFVRSGEQHYLSPVHMGVSTEYGALHPGCKGIWAWAVHAILLPMKAIPFGPKKNYCM